MGASIIYAITNDDEDIENSAEAMAADYEASREIMKMALEEYVTDHIDAFMQDLRELADSDEKFEDYVADARYEWKRVNP